MPLSAIEDQQVLDEIVGRLEDISDIGNGVFAVRIGLAVGTVGEDAGQLINMLFGNTSLQDDVTLYDAEFPDELVRCFGGPHHGLAGLRHRAGIKGRALTCTALKPQGLAPDKLADLLHGLPAAASISSRMTMGSPIRRIPRLRNACVRLGTR